MKTFKQNYGLRMANYTSEVHDKLRGRFWFFSKPSLRLKEKLNVKKIIEKMTSSYNVCTYTNHILGPLAEFVALDK